jgi:hypothetical protein
MPLLRTGRTHALGAGLAVIGLALAAPAAAAPTRAEFVARSEALCKATSESITAHSRRLFRKYERLRPKGRFSEFTNRQRRRDDALYFGSYGRALVFRGRAIHALDRQLVLVAGAPDDAPVIAQWIESRRVNAELIKQAGRQVVRISKRKPRYLLKLLFSIDSIDDQLGLTDLIVGSYGFDECFLAPDSSF